MGMGPDTGLQRYTRRPSSLIVPRAGDIMAAPGVDVKKERGSQRAWQREGATR
jgi:hypothetical protein